MRELRQCLTLRRVREIMGEAGRECGWDITVNGQAHIPMPAGPTRQTGKPTTPREQAHKGSGACSRGDGSKPKWGVGLAEKKNMGRAEDDGGVGKLN